MPSPEAMFAFVATIVAIVTMPGLGMAFIAASGVGAGPKAEVVGRLWHPRRNARAHDLAALRFSGVVQLAIAAILIVQAASR